MRVTYIEQGSSSMLKWLVSRLWGRKPSLQGGRVIDWGNNVAQKSQFRGFSFVFRLRHIQMSWKTLGFKNCTYNKYTEDLIRPMGAIRVFVAIDS